MNSNKLLEFLIECYENNQSLLSCVGLNTLTTLAHHPDSEIRSWTAKGLVLDSPNDSALNILCELAVDADPSVRVEATDSLSAYHCIQSFDTLKEMQHDPDGMVRKYVALGISDIGHFLFPVEAARLLKNMENTEEDTSVLAAIFQGLYLLGDDSYLERLLCLFDTEDYLLQCTVLHGLETILSHRNASRIKNFVNGLSITELPKAVSSTVLHLLESCIRVML